MKQTLKSKNSLAFLRNDFWLTLLLVIVSTTGIVVFNSENVTFISVKIGSTISRIIDKQEHPNLNKKIFLFKE